MSSNYEKSFCEDTVVARSIQFHNENTCTGKMASLCWIKSLDFIAYRVIHIHVLCISSDVLIYRNHVPDLRIHHCIKLLVNWIWYWYLFIDGIHLSWCNCLSFIKRNTFVTTDGVGLYIACVTSRSGELYAKGIEILSYKYTRNARWFL